MPDWFDDVASWASVLSLTISIVTMFTTLYIGKTVRKKAKMIAYSKERSKIIDTLSYYMNQLKTMDTADENRLMELQGYLSRVKVDFSVLLDKKLTENIDDLVSNTETYIYNRHRDDLKRKCYRKLMVIIGLLSNL